MEAICGMCGALNRVKAVPEELRVTFTRKGMRA
jgi:hypothetical protein